MTPMFCPIHQAVIDRSTSEGVATLKDGDGVILDRFDGGSWSDDQIKMALDLANTAFNMGHAAGAIAARSDIQRALGLKD